MSDGKRCCDNCEYMRDVDLIDGGNLTVCDAEDMLREVRWDYYCDRYEPWERGEDHDQ